MNGETYKIFTYVEYLTTPMFFLGNHTLIHPFIHYLFQGISVIDVVQQINEYMKTVITEKNRSVKKMISSALKCKI